jgi:hypothetical protein
MVLFCLDEATLDENFPRIEPTVEIDAGRYRDGFPHTNGHSLWEL